MTTETTCLSSIWETDERDGGLLRDPLAARRTTGPCTRTTVPTTTSTSTIELDKVEPMIALPFHPSNAYTIQEFSGERRGHSRAAWRRTPSSGIPKAHLHLTDKIHDGGVWADQGVIAGCAGGLFDNIAEAADILRGKLTGQRSLQLSTCIPPQCPRCPWS